MKSRRTLESVADQTSEMWENGSTSPQIVDLIAKEVGNIACEAPMREQAAGMYGVDAFHPFNLANVDINALRNLCTAIHDFGRSRFAAYKMVLMSEGVFRQEVRTTVWMNYIWIALFGRQWDWLKLYLTLYVEIRGVGMSLSAICIQMSSDMSLENTALANDLRWLSAKTLSASLRC